MATKKKGKKRGGRRGIRIGAMVGMAAGLYVLWKTPGNETNKPAEIVKALTGYDYRTGAWNWKDAKAAIPMIAGVGLSFAASKIGLNRYTPRGINI